jgi:hypothetical protein
VAARSITGVFVLGVVTLAGLAVTVRRLMADPDHLESAVPSHE